MSARRCAAQIEPAAMLELRFTDQPDCQISDAGDITTRKRGLHFLQSIETRFCIVVHDPEPIHSSIERTLQAFVETSGASGVSRQKHVVEQSVLQIPTFS